MNQHRLKCVTLTLSFSFVRSIVVFSKKELSLLFSLSLFGELWLSSFFFDSTTKVTKFVLVFTLSATQRNVSSSRHATVEIIQESRHRPRSRPFEMLQKKTFLFYKNTISDTMRSQKLSELLDTLTAKTNSFIVKLSRYEHREEYEFIVHGRKE